MNQNIKNGIIHGMVECLEKRGSKLGTLGAIASFTIPTLGMIAAMNYFSGGLTEEQQNAIAISKHNNTMLEKLLKQQAETMEQGKTSSQFSMPDMQSWAPWAAGGLGAYALTKMLSSDKARKPPNQDKNRLRMQRQQEEKDRNRRNTRYISQPPRYKQSDYNIAKNNISHNLDKEAGIGTPLAWLGKGLAGLTLWMGGSHAWDSYIPSPSSEGAKKLAQMNYDFGKGMQKLTHQKMFFKDPEKYKDMFVTGNYWRQPTKGFWQSPIDDLKGIPGIGQYMTPTNLGVGGASLAALYYLMKNKEKKQRNTGNRRER